MTTVQYTPNFNVPVPNRDKRFWHDEYRAGMMIFDGVLAKYVAVNQFRGVWTPSTLFEMGDTVVDPDNAGLYQAVSSHTSPATGTFADDRVANPTRWTDVSFLVRFRGTWLPSTSYNRGDFVVSQYIYAICITAHTSTPSGAIDDVNNVQYWQFLVDLSDTVNDINNQLFRRTQIISGAHVITNADKNNLLVYNGTGDTWTIDATGLDDEFEVAIVNYGNGGLSIDPEGAQTIDLAGTLLLDGIMSVILTRLSASEFRVLSKTYLSYTANTVLAGPATGAFGTVSMRALVAADMPAQNILAKAANYNVSAMDDKNALVIVTAAATISLPASPPTGFTVTVYNAHASPIIVDTVGTETIAGSSSITISPSTAATIVHDGANYILLSSGGSGGGGFASALMFGR